jgi:hypothetical protein
MGITEIVSAKIIKPKEKMNWGDALGLWDIAKFKVIGLTQIEFFLAQVKDADLKTQLEIGVENIIVPHIEKIQRLLHSEGLEVPSVPQRKNLDVIGKNIEPNTYIQDDEIANTSREIYRLGLNLDMKALSDATREDVRNLIWTILNDDYRAFDIMIKSQQKKNWLIAPPTI